MSTQKKKSRKPAPEKVFLTQVRGYLDYWQPQLRLIDWDVMLQEADHDSNVFAQVQICPGSLRAILKVRDPQFVSDNSSFSSDLEVSTVHELLHLRFCEAQEIIHETHKELPDTYERSIELTAMALVAARRNKPVLSLY